MNDPIYKREGISRKGELLKSVSLEHVHCVREHPFLVFALHCLRAFKTRYNDTKIVKFIFLTVPQYSALSLV